MIVRPRRLRTTELMRKFTRETHIAKSSLVAPLFIKEGTKIKDPIKNMDGQFHFSKDMICSHVESLLEQGINQILLFGIPSHKDEYGSSAYDENGVIQQCVSTLKKAFGVDILIVTDVCMCDYTSHGHCGIVACESVDNDKTLPYLAKIALSHARAGADIVAPSDMMDGRVNAIRKMLDDNNYIDVSIMSYAVKYASNFYKPFRNAVSSAPQFGDRKQYQMDFHNSKEAIKEANLDKLEGADFLIVKPALSYLDIISKISNESLLPVAAYSVSGEYAMIKAASSFGVLDEYQVMCETAVSTFRAGANILISYYAKELAQAINRGDIG